jgi:hypothetical protein
MCIIFPKANALVVSGILPPLGVYTGEYLDAYLDEYKSQIYEQYPVATINLFALG